MGYAFGRPQVLISASCGLDLADDFSRLEFVDVLRHWAMAPFVQPELSRPKRMEGEDRRLPRVPPQRARSLGGARSLILRPPAGCAINARLAGTESTPKEIEAAGTSA